jgi:hypothetical protein
MSRRWEPEAALPKRSSRFTLVELLISISISILGMITSVLALATVTVIKTTPVTESHINDARSLRALSSCLAQNAISTPATLVTDPAQPLGFCVAAGRQGLCGTPSDSTNLVQLV